MFIRNYNGNYKTLLLFPNDDYSDISNMCQMVTCTNNTYWCSIFKKSFNACGKSSSKGMHWNVITFIQCGLSTLNEHDYILSMWIFQSMLFDGDLMDCDGDINSMIFLRI